MWSHELNGYQGKRHLSVGDISWFYSSCPRKEASSHRICGIPVNPRGSCSCSQRQCVPGKAWQGERGSPANMLVWQPFIFCSVSLKEDASHGICSWGSHTVLDGKLDPGFKLLWSVWKQDGFDQSTLYEILKGWSKTFKLLLNLNLKLFNGHNFTINLMAKNWMWALDCCCF